MRVIVAMSGGVDSSVAAALLAEEGRDVVGVTMRIGSHDTVEPNPNKPTCCGVDGIRDARQAADALGIPYYPVNYERLFGEKVVDYFADEYLNGRTPNPCVKCNQDLKFGELTKLADELGADYVATGHYAQVEERGGRMRLLRGADADKDQSYSLFSLTQRQLKRSLFPIGELTKEEVRRIARDKGLANADKPESQEICFIPDDNYKRFLQERLPGQIRPGKIVDAEGRQLGEHAGAPFFTIGQRRGLGIASGTPNYVMEIDAPQNRVVVGKAADLMRSECALSGVNWLSVPRPEKPIRARVKIRYKDRGAWASVEAVGGEKAHARFDEPRRAVTPGQAAVFYDDEGAVLGGGWIDALKRTE